MPAATAAERHAARARDRPRGAHAPAPRLRTGRPPARGSGAPRPVTGVFERIKALPDHRVIDRLLRGRVWICFIGVALMGIVAMQVSMLKLNSGISRAVETTATLERQNSDMEASIARLASGERIRAAADKGGMVTPAAGERALPARARRASTAACAARRMRAPSDDAKALMANHGVVPGSLMAPRRGRRRPPRHDRRGHDHAATPAGHAGRDTRGSSRDAGADTGRDGAAHHRHAGGNDSPHRLTACG